MEQARSGQPVFTLIGGPNGVGKSTYADRLAAASYDLGEVVNPDVIAAALAGPDTTRDARAGRETLHRTRTLIVGMARRGVMAWRVDMPGLQWLDRITERLARSASMGHRRSGDDIGRGRT